MAQVTGDRRLQSSVLEDLSDAHNYRRWLAELARPHLGDHPIEIGSGTGDYALEWAARVGTFTATEADEGRYKTLKERFAGHDTVRVRHLLLADDRTHPCPGHHHGEDTDAQDRDAHDLNDPDLNDPDLNDPGGDVPDGDAAPGGHSAAVALNVLEHIPDDVGALRSMARLVRPGGAVILVVPAFPSAMSQFDLAIGHQRRYTRASLGAALADARLPVRELRYINPLGLLGWYVTVKALRMTPRNGAVLRLYDRVVVPLARLADRVPAPFGQSVFAVARRAPSGRQPPG